MNQGRGMGSATVAIAGGGVGGLATAVALARRGVRCAVFERSNRLRSGGGALILWSNALRALDEIGLRDALLARPTAQPVEVTEMRRSDGRFLSTMPVGEVSRKYGAPTVVLARGDLLDTLEERAGGVADLRYGVAVDDFRDEGPGVRVSLSDGTTQHFDALVGADGLHSTLRKRLGLDQRLRDLGQELWVATTTVSVDGLEPGLTTACLGAGIRFWHALMRDGRTFWYATLLRDRFDRMPATLGELAAEYAGWYGSIEEIIRSTREEDVFRTPMRDRPPALPWGRGGVTLLGDAAHAMTPDLGQGACQAIESAVVLARSWRDDVPRALRAYEQVRYRRTSELNRMSFLSANTSGVAGPIECVLRDTAIRVGLRRTFESQLGWIFQGP